VAEIRSAAGAREVPLLDLYRLPTGDNRSLLALEPGELVVGVALPATPDASAYERLGERAAFSFPLVSVAAVRRGTETRLVAAGVANIPRELDAADPLAGLPGNPQTGWKRRALETLVERATAAVA
jgi:xanthine dehydrogenase YagS FAD-binding subunit